MKILIALLMALTSCTALAQQSPLTVTDPFGTFRLPDPRLGNENDVASAGASLMGVFTGADPLRVVVQVDFNGFTDEHQPYKYSRLFVVHFRGGFSPALQDGTVMPYIDASVTPWEVDVSGGSNASSRGVVTLGVGRTRYSQEHALSNGGTLVITPLQASVDGEIVPLRAGGFGAFGRLAGSILGIAVMNTYRNPSTAERLNFGTSMEATSFEAQAGIIYRILETLSFRASMTGQLTAQYYFVDSSVQANVSLDILEARSRRALFSVFAAFGYFYRTYTAGRATIHDTAAFTDGIDTSTLELGVIAHF